MTRGYTQTDSINPVVVAQALKELENDQDGTVTFEGPTFNTAMRTCTVVARFASTMHEIDGKPLEYRSRITWGYLNRANYWAKLYWLICDLYAQADAGIAGMAPSKRR